VSELKDTKFVKAKCSKTGISFAIEIKKFGSTWKAVDFVRLTEEQARKMESQVTVSEIVSAESILDCDVCRNRKIGGCSCPSKGRVCKVSDPYRFQCIYCDKLQLDYSAATGIKEGEKIILAQGQVITLSKRNANISKLEVGVGWRPSLSGANMDLDASAAMLSNSNSLYETVCYWNLDDNAHSIHHHGDSTTGSEKDQYSDADDEVISIDLDKVPKNVSCIAFIVNIYKCADRSQNFGQVRDLHIRLTEKTTNHVMAQYNASSHKYTDTGMIIGAAFRTGSQWSFKAIGESMYVDSLEELADICRDRCRSLING